MRVELALCFFPFFPRIRTPVAYHLDRWNFDPATHTLTRLHVRPRKALFTPEGTKDFPFDRSKLADVRETYVEFVDGRTQHIVDEEFRNLESDPKRALDAPWKGKTVFKLCSVPTGMR